jgi:hypothetical protein
MHGSSAFGYFRRGKLHGLGEYLKHGLYTGFDV